MTDDQHTAELSTEPILTVRNLVTQVRSGTGWTDVLRGIDVAVRPGETLGVAGESGSGKSMLALSVLGLLPGASVRVKPGSEITFQGIDLIAAPASERRSLLGNRLCAVFQDPLTSLNPVFTVGEQIAEVIRRHRHMDRRRTRREVVRLLQAVHIPDAARRAGSYPHEMSGGQRQRVAIAMAIANEPSLLIADEPTTALDVTVQAEILALLAELRERMHMAMMFITHDLGVVRDVCDQVAVMYAGRIVERCAVEQLFARPLHPYSRGLLACAPALGRRQDPRPIPGMPPSFEAIGAGCAFADRCDVATADCRLGDIVLRSVDRREVACIRPGAVPADVAGRGDPAGPSAPRGRTDPAEGSGPAGRADSAGATGSAGPPDPADPGAGAP